MTVLRIPCDEKFLKLIKQKAQESDVPVSVVGRALFQKWLDSPEAKIINTSPQIMFPNENPTRNEVRP